MLVISLLFGSLMWKGSVTLVFYSLASLAGGGGGLRPGHQLCGVAPAHFSSGSIQKSEEKDQRSQHFYKKIFLVLIKISQELA